jgi:gliding motility-associated-like protein
MEPGFNFITSSRGCAPFTIEIQTLFLNSTPGTIYHVDWGDGSAIEDYNQTMAYPNGPIITHEYINAPIACGYQVTIEVENACNPTGSVDAVVTNVIVWTDDLVASAPDVFRVCQGFAANIDFNDNSNWNCFPRADLRENADPRWIQWIYGDPTNAARIPGITIDGVSPGSFPYYNPALGTDPVYPVTDIDQTSLMVAVPVTGPTDLGKEFYVTLNNWNTCNAYDENLSDGNPINPITPGGDNDPRMYQSRIVIVETPEPKFVTKKESTGVLASDFCIGDLILFENQTLRPGGSNLIYTWEFFDGPTPADGLLETKTNRSPVFSYPTGGQKLVRLTVGDNNAVGGCQATLEKIVRITPTAIAQIGTANTSFCKTPGSAETFSVTFTDETVGSIPGVDEWAWELFDENGNPLQRVPASGYNSGGKVSVVQDYTNPGVYRARLTYRDIITQCDTYDQINIVIYNNPEPSFAAPASCEGLESDLIDATQLDMINGNQVIRWEWDFDYDKVNFNPDTVFNATRPDTLKKQFNYGTHQVALRATNDQNGCSAIFTEIVEVYQNPQASFTKDAMEGCSPLVVNLENTAVSTQPVVVDQYIWCIDYGNGYIDTLRTDPNTSSFDPVIETTFESWNTQSKNFRFLLKAVSENGCEAMSAPDSVKVLPSLKPGFRYIDYEPLAKNCSPVEVNFQVDMATRALSPTNYIWTVEDESGVLLEETIAGTTALFTYQFTSEDKSIHSYTVNLKANIEDICAGDSTLSVNVNPIPNSAFTIDTLDINCESMTIEVDAKQKGLVDYNWTITRGAMIFMNDTIEDSFIYTVPRPAPGRENLYLGIDLITANYAFCESEKTSQNINVPAQPNLVAEFIANPEIQVFPNATVTFNNLSTRSGAIHFWDFGDGNTSSAINPGAHTYSTPGNYTILLELKEDFCSSIDSVNIYIQPTAPVADFTADPPNGCIPLTVNFTNLTKYGDPDSYIWYFGEGQSISRTENPTYTYYEPGVYSVKLEATNASGVTDIVVKKFIIEAYPVPHADFTVRPEKVKLPDDPIYTTNLSFEADSYFWDFGDGGKSIEFEPAHIYTDTGRYDITLIAATEKGCADTVTYENIVEVIDGNEIRIPNAFTPTLDGPTGGNRYNEGRNDVFYPVTEGVIAYHMQIYNRWGELLFDTNDSGKGWDGYYNGKICPPDVYIYKIDFKFIDGREVMKFGDVALIR